MPAQQTDWTAAMVRALPDDGKRYEVVDGELNVCLEGDLATGRIVLRDLVNATVGFEGLARRLGLPSKSVHRMLSARGNPSSENFFAIIGALMRETDVKLSVAAARRVARRPSRY